MRDFVILVNPISGDGRAAQRVRPVAEALRGAGGQVAEILTKGSDHARQEARRAAESGAVVVAAGGDGLVRDVASGVAPAGGVMGIVPAGRGNDFARRIGIPQDTEGQIHLLRDGEPRPIDVMECAGSTVPGNLYVGIDSVANQMINSSRWLPGLLVYRMAPVITVLRWRPATFTVGVDGTDHTVRGHTIVVANSGAYGHGLLIVPSAVVDDGELDVMTIGEIPRWKIGTVMREATEGRHVHRPEITVHRGREVTISADRALPVFADGDYLTELPVTVRLHPGRLRVLRP